MSYEELVRGRFRKGQVRAGDVEVLGSVADGEAVHKSREYIASKALVWMVRQKEMQAAHVNRGGGRGRGRGKRRGLKAGTLRTGG